MHISVIGTKGTAKANEYYSIARNTNVPNFRDFKGENYIKNAKYTIRYVNNEMSVYINGARYIKTR